SQQTTRAAASVRDADELPLRRLQVGSASVTTAPAPVERFVSLPVARIVSPMLAKLNTFTLVGIDAVPVEAEVDVSAGLPKTVIVGSNGGICLVEPRKDI